MIICLSKVLLISLCRNNTFDIDLCVLQFFYEPNASRPLVYFRINSQLLLPARRIKCQGAFSLSEFFATKTTNSSQHDKLDCCYINLTVDRGHASALWFHLLRGLHFFVTQPCHAAHNEGSPPHRHPQCGRHGHSIVMQGPTSACAAPTVRHLLEKEARTANACRIPAYIQTKKNPIPAKRRLQTERASRGTSI